MKIIGEIAVDLIYHFPDTLQGTVHALRSILLFQQVLQQCAGKNVADPPIIIGCSVQLHAVCPVETRMLAQADLVALGDRIKREFITLHLAAYGAILVELCFVTYAVRQC